MEDEPIVNLVPNAQAGDWLAANIPRFECPAAELSADVAEWIADYPALTIEAENALAVELGLRPGDLLLDYPTKTQMLSLDIPVLRRDGGIRRLTAEGWEGSMNLPKLSEELYRSARLFVNCISFYLI